MEEDLIAVMMPFSAALKPTYETIKESAKAKSFRAIRVDDI